MTLAITNDNFQAGNAIVASEMNTNFTEVENYINNSLPTLAGANTFAGTAAFNAAVTITSTLAFTGALSGTNSVPRMAYRGDGAATVASNQMNANPTIFICTTEPTATSTGDIWIDI